MTTFISLLLEVTDGDDLAFDGGVEGSQIVVEPRPGDRVVATLIRFGYVAPEKVDDP